VRSSKSKPKCGGARQVQVPFLWGTSTESLESSDDEGDIAGGETEKSLGGNSESSSLDADARWSLDNSTIH